MWSTRFIRRFRARQSWWGACSPEDASSGAVPVRDAKRLRSAGYVADSAEPYEIRLPMALDVIRWPLSFCAKWRPHLPAPQISNVIFTGPAGTGKTLAAKRQAVAVIEGWAPDSLAEVSERFRQLVEQGRIHAPTLHPNYSYSDWVEGYRPSTTEEGQLTWTVEPGIFLRAVSACAAPTINWYFRPGETITSSTNTSYDVIEVDPYRVSLYRHDNRRTLTTTRTDVHFADVQHCIERGVEPRELSYSGADEETRLKRAAVAGRLDWSTTQLTNSGALRAVYEHYLASRDGTADSGLPVVLMIDEINRADPGRLWGEAITILEPNKRQGQPEEQPVQLQYSQRSLTLPANLHLVGTMNSADRSIAQFDVAYRRRFDFVWVGPDESLVDPYGGVHLAAILRRVNLYLRRELGRDRQIGHAELMKHKLEARLEEHGWQNDLEGQLKAVLYTFRVWLLPLLRDLLGNDLVRVRTALGDSGGLVEAVVDEFASDEDDLWLDEQELLDDSGEWWDPRSEEWDLERVRDVVQMLPEAADSV